MKIQFAGRLSRLPPYLFAKINAIKHEKRQKGVDIIDLGMGNPNDPVPDGVVEKMCTAARDKRNHRYSLSVGIPNLRREAARAYKRRRGVVLDPEKEIITVIGSKEGFSHLCLALLENGDTALVPSPAYPIHIYGVALAGANVIRVPMGTGEPMLRSIVDIMDRLFPRPKVLLLNYPHNPTTAVADLDFYKEVVRLAKRYGLFVIHDFAYGETVFDGYEAPSFLEVDGARDVGVEFTTLSKPYNMAGWRVGFCAGNAEAVQALAKIKGYYDYGIFQPIQVASIIALRECDDFVKDQARTYQRRRDVLCEGLSRIGWPVEKPKATMFAWIKIPEPFAARGSMQFALDLLEQAEIAVSPGRGFGENGEGYLRFALVENDQRLRQAVRQIGRVFGLPKPASEPERAAARPKAPQQGDAAS